MSQAIKKMVSHRPRVRGLLGVAAALWLSSAGAFAATSLMLSSDQCSEFGCCFELGSTVPLSVVALPNGDSPGAHRFDLLFDSGLLQVVDVSSPDAGPFAEVPVESCVTSPGVVTLGGLYCENNGGGAQQLAQLLLEVVAPAATDTAIEFANLELLGTDLSAIDATGTGRSIFLGDDPDGDCDRIPDAQDNCPDNFNPDQNPEACEPLLVELIRFEATRTRGTVVRISWETALERDNVGFNLYSAPSPDGPWMRINGDLIPARGSELAGAGYEYRDARGRKGRLFYRLEDIDRSGQSTSHPPVSVAGRSGKGVDSRALSASGRKGGGR